MSVLLRGVSLLSFLAGSLGSASLPLRARALVLTAFRMLLGEELERLLLRSCMGLLRLCLKGVRTSLGSSTRPTWFSSLKAGATWVSKLLTLVLLACLTLTRRLLPL